jgi:cystathionine beta-synthase
MAAQSKRIDHRRFQYLFSLLSSVSMQDNFARSTLEMIGNTPLLEVRELNTGPCRLFLKLENQNPGGSIKDRIGLYLIAAAERSGKLSPGCTLVEATAGNTGLGLALVAARKGYPLRLVIPDKMSQEKIYHLRALGAEIIMTRSDVPKGHPEYYQDLAARIARETPNSYYINQFGNPANIQAHEETTGPEILQQMAQQVDAVVCGVGTGGTITGLSRYFARSAPQLEMVLADPQHSALAGFVHTGKVVASGRGWLVEGIGGDYLPAICDLSYVKKAYAIPDTEAFETCRLLLAREGILAGTSSGTLIAAALRYCREQTEAKRVVTFVCDSGNKYLSKVYNDYWMIDNGFLQREKYGDLRDLIVRRHQDRATVIIDVNESVAAAHRRMRLYDVSQLPVMQDGKVIGVIDEEDILAEVAGNPQHFSESVRAAMSSNLVTVPADASLEQLMAVFKRGMVALIMHQNEFIGLVTRIDLLNWLRRRADI